MFQHRRLYGFSLLNFGTAYIFLTRHPQLIKVKDRGERAWHPVPRASLPLTSGHTPNEALGTRLVLKAIAETREFGRVIMPRGKRRMQKSKEQTETVVKVCQGKG